ncbi:MAG: hypothetical protein Q9M17_03170 [Mariprofundus sp.]|nr:hypothetical protein [Mariprofundus sp.]
MKNLLLMGVFGMLMAVAFAGQSVSGVSLVTAAYAGGGHGHDDDDDGYGGSCPDGVATCIRADGSSYTDLNNLPATAAGNDDGNDDGTTSAATPSTTDTHTFANPRNQRSF